MSYRNPLEGSLTHAAFLQRENSIRHHYYDEDMLQYEYIRDGNMDAVEINKNMFTSNKVGHLSDDPVKNYQYHFICAVAIITRYVIEGGMEPETAYNSSDIFIQRVDKCRCAEEIIALHEQMITFYTTQMAKLKNTKRYSKPIIQCMDYIYYHLHEPVTVAKLAEHVKLNPSYLSVLFKKEVTVPISEYISGKRIEAAQNMLKYSGYTCLDISNYLAFSTYSYFISVFKKHTGLTPKEYREKHYRTSISSS